VKLIGSSLAESIDGGEDLVHFFLHVFFDLLDSAGDQVDLAADPLGLGAHSLVNVGPQAAILDLLLLAEILNGHLEVLG